MDRRLKGRVLRAGQVGNGGERGEPRRRGQQLGRCAPAVAVGRVGVGRVCCQAGEVLAGPAHRAVAGCARVRVLVVPVAAVVGDGQSRRRRPDVRDGQRGVRVNQRREIAAGSPCVGTANPDVVDAGVADGVVRSAGGPGRDGDAVFCGGVVLVGERGATRVR